MDCDLPPTETLLPVDFYNDGVARPVIFGKSFFEDLEDEDTYMSVTCEFWGLRLLTSCCPLMVIHRKTSIGGGEGCIKVYILKMCEFILQVPIYM